MELMDIYILTLELNIIKIFRPQKRLTRNFQAISAKIKNLRENVNLQNTKYRKSYYQLAGKTN